MTSVQFDEGAADKLARAAASAADNLRNQAGIRRSAVEDAATDFHGVYADRFLEAARIEAMDRPKLIGVLDGLSDLIKVVSDEARREKQRQKDVAAWKARDADRRRASAADPLAAAAAWGQSVFDPRPSETAIVPTPIDVAFSAQARTRTGGGSSHGRSSANPSKLRKFASSAGAADASSRAALSRLRNAWIGFESSCAWAPVTSMTFLAGFERILTENAADATWVGSIADAFDRAGKAHSLGNTALDIAISGALPSKLRRALAGGLTPTELAKLWAEMPWAHGSDEDKNDLAALPLPVLAQVGNLEGIPYWARGTANVAVLTARFDDARRTSSGNLLALKKILLSTRSVGADGPRTLISLTADEPPLAAVAIGDVDTTESVTWTVPGMASSSKKMTDWTDAAQNLYDAQNDVDPDRDHAVIAWMGYDAPPIPGLTNDTGVFHTDRARVGGDNLAASIRGLDAVRSGDMPATNVFAHSYGTTAAALGLTHRGVKVDTLTTAASAGIPDSIPNADAIHAGAVYAGQARNVIPILESGENPLLKSGLGDQYAATGRDHSSDHHRDPTADYFGAKTFGADGDDGNRPVTDHGVSTSSGGGYLDPGTESLNNIALATTGHGESMTPYLPKPSTGLEKALDAALHAVLP